RSDEGCLPPHPPKPKPSPTCIAAPDPPHRAWEVGGGRTARQPGQVRKEAALTSTARVVVSLPPNFRAAPWRRSDRAAPRAIRMTLTHTAGAPYQVLARKYRPRSFASL